MEREEVGRAEEFAELSIAVSFQHNQPAFYIGILSALLWPYCILFLLYLSLFLPLLTLAPGREEINHHTDPRARAYERLSSLSGSERTLFTNECRFSLCALSPTPPPEYLSASDEQCLLLPVIPNLVTHNISH